MVRASGLVRSFQTRSGRVRGVADLSFEAGNGRIFTLLGPSGCGKTTTMRLVAGLDSPDEGSIWIGGDLVADASRGWFLPPAARGVGMVFQSYALWPHMDVFENIAFPLRVRRLAAAEIR